jgi:hypothetical protein
MYVGTYVRTYTCLCMYVGMYVCMYDVCMMYVLCMYVCVYVCMYACMYLCVCVCMKCRRFHFWNNSANCKKAYHVPHITGLGWDIRTEVKNNCTALFTSCFNAKSKIHNPRKKRNVIDLLVFCVINWLLCNITTTPLFIFGKYKYFPTF